MFASIQPIPDFEREGSDRGPLPEREGIHLNPGIVPLAASAVSEEPDEEDPQPQPGEPRGGTTS